MIKALASTALFVVILAWAMAFYSRSAVIRNSNMVYAEQLVKSYPDLEKYFDAFAIDGVISNREVEVLEALREAEVTLKRSRNSWETK